ncbi:uncharacterized protein DEA37_0008659 [Paragonimus westermani]|uniref:Uncharacterized protein n=1 Tax=Paragonimus westermani TaxID=34504 RepID=A0A5J4NJU5_9TREM|nr:uncharacterized protein DEA37_0008659 [Paragonimus westermani]
MFLTAHISPPLTRENRQCLTLIFLSVYPGITNATFHCGSADKVLNNLLSTFPRDSTVVAVVDPPRSGLHFSHFSGYSVSFSFVRPTSNRFQGAPFVPLLAEPVDLFPQTRHIEVILLLQRVCGGEQDKIV